MFWQIVAIEIKPLNMALRTLVNTLLLPRVY